MGVTNKGSQYIYVPSGCLSFDGTNDRVETPSGATKNWQNFTITFWTNPDEWTSNNAIYAETS